MAHYSQIYNLEDASWTFSESGHGKGAPDGVGAALKRSADLAVLSGANIESAQQLQSSLTTTKIEIHVVNSSAINEEEKVIPKVLPAIPKCSEVHQAVWKKSEAGILTVRNVPCPCIRDNASPGNCFHYNSRGWNFGLVDAYPSSVAPPVAHPISADPHTSPDIHAFQCLDWVAMRYGTAWYVGSVLEIDVDAKELRVNSMHWSSGKHLVWPAVEDNAWYDATAMICKVSAPTIAGRLSWQLCNDDIIRVQRLL